MKAQQRDALVEAVLHMPIPTDSAILLAVSGGSDSMALLDAMTRAVTSGERHWRLRVAHVNHHLRGKEADDDEAFVAKQADAYSLPFHLAHVDVVSFAHERHLSIETAARHLRYEALRTMLNAWGQDVIATGHTRDDQVETVVMRLLRGSGIRGLSGIPYVSGDLVRPLLQVRKSTVLAELDRRNVPFRLDSSNTDESHRRNAIRRRVIPALIESQPSLPEIVARTAALLAKDADLLDSVGRESLKLSTLSHEAGKLDLSRPILQALQPGLNRAVMAAALRQVAADTEPDVRLYDEFRRVLEANTDTLTQVRRGLYAISRDAHFFISDRTAVPPEEKRSWILSQPGHIDTVLGRLVVQTYRSTESRREASAVLGPMHMLAGIDEIRWPLEIRTRLSGDHIAPERGVGSKTLQDLFVDRKMPRVSRDRLAVVVDQVGVLWVPGVERDRRIVAIGDTVELLHLRFIPHSSAFHGKIR